MSKGSARTAVVVADDHPLYRRAVIEAIKGRANLEFVGEAADGRAALEAIREARPDIAVLDVRMPQLDGLAVLNAVVRDGLATKVIFLTAHVDSGSAYEAVGAGAAAYLAKEASAEVICDAIAAVARGETVLAPEVQAGIAREIRLRSGEERPVLTPREREILALTADGHSAPEIAERLTLSPTTVRTHLQHLYDKLGVSDRAAAVAEAMRRGLLEVTDWIAGAAERIAVRAERELEALVAVSSPSGDVHGAEEALAVCAALLPDEATVERPPCSSPGHAPDLLAHLPGTGTGRLLLLGHVDTVIAHDDHRPLRREGNRLAGSGAVDMKGGVVLALGVLRHLAAAPAHFAQAALLLVCDEEWRTAPFAHAERFRGWDACLCFEAGQQGRDGTEGVVVRRKAAGTLKVLATGASAHSGSAPDRGRNALLALARAAEAVAAVHDPAGPGRLTAVPTVLRSGEAFNVVPAAGELFCDLRADDASAFETAVRAVPAEVGGATLQRELVRVWPGMDQRAQTAPVLEAASALLGRAVAGQERGGASDASHLATVVPVTVDGLGPRGGGAHSPAEHVLAPTLRERAEVALAVAAAALQST